MAARVTYLIMSELQAVDSDRRGGSLLAQLRAIRTLLESDRFDWLVVLGTPDDPIGETAAVEASLDAADGVDAFIETHRCPVPSRAAEPVDEFALRYHYRWSRVPAGAGPIARVLAAISGRHLAFQTTPDAAWLGMPAKRSPFTRPRRDSPLLPRIRRNLLDVTTARPPDPLLSCHRGPDRFILSRRAAEAIDASLRDRPSLAVYYRDTVRPTESYIHTVLANDRSMTLASDWPITRY